MALQRPLEEKIRISIGLLRLYEPGALTLWEQGFYLAFSGGKDSCVIKQLAVEAGVRFEARYSCTTIDPPELIRFIKKYHKTVKWNVPEISMMKRVESVKGLPTRQQRWCCSEYKEQGGNGLFKVLGVRISESTSRAKRWKEFCRNRNGGNILAPIIYWTDEDVWTFIRSRNLEYCELYDQGFTRLGCVGCPLSGHAGQKKEFARWPRYEANWKRACFGFWNNWHGILTENGERRFFEDFGSAQGLWDWWRSGKAFEGEVLCTQEEMMLNT